MNMSKYRVYFKTATTEESLVSDDLMSAKDALAAASSAARGGYIVMVRDERGKIAYLDKLIEEANAKGA
jgi:hypothetical protein